MPRPNRVDPFGSLIITPARGTLMGNRGRLHDAEGRIGGRQWSTRAWIACRLEFKGRHRTIMAPGRYTELFFLDEATALAAGHRPCGECRRDDYRRFRGAFEAGDSRLELSAHDDVSALDRLLHRERLSRPPWSAAPAPAVLLDDLPDGAMVTRDDLPGAWLVWQGRLLRWTPFGYDSALPRMPDIAMRLITPLSIVAAIKAGYLPTVHPSAQAFSA